jgi:twitching motility protein PilT
MSESDDDFGIPNVDELWPDRTSNSGNAQASDTHVNDGIGELRAATERLASALVTPPATRGPTAPSRAIAVKTTSPNVGSMESTVTMDSPRLNGAQAQGSSPAHTSSAARPRAANVPAGGGESVLEQVLITGASWGASTVYLQADTPVSIRAHGAFRVLEGAPVLSSDEIETLLVGVKLAQLADPRRVFTETEWTFDVPQVGRVRCTAVKDHRGTGATFEIVPTRQADESDLSLDVQLLAAERDGLVVVAGQRGSGKLRTMHQLATLVARHRGAHMIAVQRGPGLPVPNGVSISQREARGGLDDVLDVARAALRENPDVLILQEMPTAPLVTLALDAAASGQLVIAGVTAPTALASLDRIIESYPSEHARSVQRRLAQHLRGIVAQMPVPNADGGLVTAQELLLMTHAIAAILREGQLWQMRAALKADAGHGLVTLSERLVDLVRAGEIRAEDAYRHAPDPTALLLGLKRHGIDASFAGA